MRVSTIGNYSAILDNLMAAQQRQVEAGNEVSTQKKGKNLKDYAANAEMLTSMRSVQTRLQVYTDQNSLVADKLNNQDTALNQVADAAGGARQVIADALASGQLDTLMQDLQGQFGNAVDGLNARYGGKYLFGGGQIDTAPVSATAMADLTNPATPAISDFFHNDQYKSQAKIDDATTVTTGVLASDIGTNLLAAFKSIQQAQLTGPGPFTGKMTDTQRTFLEGQLANWDTVRSDITTLTGRNGLVQKRVDSVVTDLGTRQNNLAGMMGGITDADMAQAATNLQLAQMSVQAAAQVFSTLQSSSLLALLR
jgi:flagellar hook-associated protein 3 FlgL